MGTCHNVTSGDTLTCHEWSQTCSSNLLPASNASTRTTAVTMFRIQTRDTNIFLQIFFVLRYFRVYYLSTSTHKADEVEARPCLQGQGGTGNVIPRTFPTMRIVPIQLLYGSRDF